MNNRAPIIAVLVFLSPVLYVGSYMAVVNPYHRAVFRTREIEVEKRIYYKNYRAFSTVADRLYWPLEQLDRQLRPEIWDNIPDFKDVDLE